MGTLDTAVFTIAEPDFLREMSRLMHRVTWFLLLLFLTGCSRKPPDTAQIHVSRVVPGAALFALEAYNRGNALRKNEKEKAIQEYSTALKLDPTLDIAVYNRALTHMELLHDKQALSDLSRLKELHSALAERLENLMGAMPVLHCDQGQRALAAKDFNQAIAKFNAALIYVPDDPKILELRAQAHRQKGEAAKAKADQDRAADSRKKGIESIMVEETQKGRGRNQTKGNQVGGK
jgi:tetratricopeptide (TPR) repeat protein